MTLTKPQRNANAELGNNYRWKSMKINDAGSAVDLHGNVENSEERTEINSCMSSLVICYHFLFAITQSSRLLIGSEDFIV